MAERTLVPQFQLFFSLVGPTVAESDVGLIRFYSTLDNVPHRGPFNFFCCR